MLLLPAHEDSRLSPAEKLSTVPSKPGVYTFRNAKERVLYVGKAKNLRSRLRSCFQDSSGLDARKAAMMREVRDFSYIVTGNELEAFVLEANLIKQFKPRFNIILKDDKNYPYLKLTVNEAWPRIEVVRRVQQDGALYRLDQDLVHTGEQACLHALMVRTAGQPDNRGSLLELGAIGCESG